MEKSGGRPKADDTWDHVTLLEGKRVKCKYCGFVFAASANRIKCHLNQIKGQGIRVCSGFPQSNNLVSNTRITSDLKENLLHSQGLAPWDRTRDDNKVNETKHDCYMSPKTMWEGIMSLQHVKIHKEAKHRKRIQVGPFLVSTVVNERDLQLIQYIFEYSRETYMEVFSSSGLFLNQSEFTTLKPRTFLDSLVIDIFAEILTDIERKKKTKPVNWYLPVTFSKAALSGDIASFMDFVERNNMRENYMSNLVNCEKIFIPVHIEKNSHGHFYLCILHMKNQEIEIWDSLSDQFISKVERDKTTQKLLLAMDKLFSEVSMFSKFQCRTANNISLQPNGYDCGIFVINFMQQLHSNVKRNPIFQFDSDEERLDLALKLLKSDLNEQKETLYNKARSHFSQGENEDSDLFGYKRKWVAACKAFSEDFGRGTCIELDDSNRRVKRNNVCVKIGCSKGYILPTTNLVGEVFQSHTNKIWEWIMEDNVSTIGIWGMGGSGKTALATHIHNKLLEEASDNFDHVIWVTVSQHESICQLQKVVAKSINLDISDEYDTKRIAGKLLQAFKHMNNCVVILDDVWDHIFVEEIGFPISDNRIKLILTTRIWEVCQGMDCKKNIIELKPVHNQDSWALFENTLGLHRGLSLEVEKIAMNIANECRGLPLAIVTIARSMKGKEHTREWDHMLDCLENLENGQCDMNKWVFPVLKSSYAFLNDKLQECFLYCALNTHNCYFHLTGAHRLIGRFVYEGWIDEQKLLKVQYNEGYNILDKLKNNSMLEESYLGSGQKKEEYFWGWRMHYLLRVMAKGIAKDNGKIMAKAYMNLREIPDDDKWKGDLEKVFLTGNKIQKIPDGTSPKCSQLSTLLLDDNYNLEWISDDFFNNMPALKILDLSATGIKRLPKSVSNLEHLIALLLSQCRKLSYMPSLAKLQRLKSLDLSHTAITEAPSGLELLVNLRCLNLQDTKELKMTTSFISKLTNLQSLVLNCIPNSIDVRVQDLQDLKKLEFVIANFYDIGEFNRYVMSFLDRDYVLINYHLILAVVDDVIFYEDMNEEYSQNMVTVEGMDLGNKTVVLPEGIKDLIIRYCHQWTWSRCLCRVLSFAENNNPHQIQLEIKWCDELEYLCCFSPSCPFCSSTQLVNELIVWCLKDLKNIVSPLAPSLYLSATLFSHLKHLTIWRCNSMEILLTPKLLAQLQNLETISVEECESMKEIAGDDDFGMILFGSGNLSHHTITLPKLTSVYLWDLLELNFIYRGIMLCPSLKRFSAQCCKKLNHPQIEISNGSLLQMEETKTGYSWPPKAKMINQDTISAVRDNEANLSSF